MVKKFSLPDNSIPADGRMVQCGSCGLKWKQFPANETKEIKVDKKISTPKKKLQRKYQNLQKKGQRKLEKLIYTHLNI